MSLTKLSLAGTNVPNPSPWKVWSKIIQESCSIFFTVHYKIHTGSSLICEHNMIFFHTWVQYVVHSMECFTVQLRIPKIMLLCVWPFSKWFIHFSLVYMKLVKVINPFLYVQRRCCSTAPCRRCPAVLPSPRLTSAHLAFITASRLPASGTYLPALQIFMLMTRSFSKCSTRVNAVSTFSCYVCLFLVFLQILSQRNPNLYDLSYFEHTYMRWGVTTV